MVKQDKIKGREAGGRESKKIAIFEVINRGAVVTKKRKGVGFEKFKCDNVGENLQGCGSSKKEKKKDHSSKKFGSEDKGRQIKGSSNF